MKINYNSFKFVFTTGFLALLITTFISCGKKDKNSPGIEFMPDMYRSPSLEYYGLHTVDGDTLFNAMLPVPGTVSKGNIPYSYPNTAEGYEQAGLNLKNPHLSKKDMFEKEGEILYGKFCVHCHGATGGGDGKVAGKLPGPPPAYNGALKNLPEGKIFHTLTYGKGTMGSHASQLTQEERWKLVFYVQKLQGPKEVVNDSLKTEASNSSTTTTVKK